MLETVWARWALTREYDITNPLSPDGGIAHHSPLFDSLTIDGRVATLKFDHVGGRLDTFDVSDPIGFAIAGEDRVFVNAKAKIIGMDTVEVWSDDVENPVAVRYAWADNPVCNVQSTEGLPMTPFRTDDWPGVTVDAVK